MTDQMDELADLLAAGAEVEVKGRPGCSPTELIGMLGLADHMEARGWVFDEAAELWGPA